MAKRGTNAKKASQKRKTSTKRNTSALAKAAENVPGLPAVARAATAIPATAIMLAAGACAMGALAYFLFAGASGQRRRELIREKALQAGETLSKSGREVRERIESVATQAARRVRGERGLANGLSDRRTGEQALPV